MIESDSLGRGCTFILVTLIGDEQIKVARVLVLEESREGEAPGASCVRLPQRFPAVFALLLPPVESFVDYRHAVPVHQRGSASGADKGAIFEARCVSLPVVTKFGFLTRKNHKERPPFFFQSSFEVAYSVGG